MIVTSTPLFPVFGVTVTPPPLKSISRMSYSSPFWTPSSLTVMVGVVKDAAFLLLWAGRRTAPVFFVMIAVPLASTEVEMSSATKALSFSLVVAPSSSLSVVTFPSARLPTLTSPAPILAEVTAASLIARVVTTPSPSLNCPSAVVSPDSAGASTSVGLFSMNELLLVSSSIQLGLGNTPMVVSRK